jgi:3-hydroxybutyryl-CoA dehydratase
MNEERQGGADPGPGQSPTGDGVPDEGDIVSYVRTFTEDDVRTFSALSNDRGEHHAVPDEDGRLLVHGLLTATLPTKVGGDMDFLARTMEFDFRRPVYTGEEIRCRVRIARLDEREDRYVGEAVVECENEAGETVMTGGFDGIIQK